jgi:hypothetical protein
MKQQKQAARALLSTAMKSFVHRLEVGQDAVEERCASQGAPNACDCPRAALFLDAGCPSFRR